MLPSNLSDEQLTAIIGGSASTEALEYESTGPGKFEGTANPGLAEKLYERTLDGCCDDQVGSVDENGYWAGLLGRFIVVEDSQGFFSYEEYPTTARAERLFREIDPYVEDEGDA